MADDNPNDQWAPWRTRITASRKRRDERVRTWQGNVTARKGGVRQPDASSTLQASNGVSINKDWAITKAKIAQLYSQTPEVRLTPTDPQFAQATQPFGQELNHVIEEVNVGATIEEELADVVNASGIAGVIISCETRTEKRVVPAVDPSTVPPEMLSQIPTMEVDHPVDRRYIVDRISPTDLLIPDDFTGSDYDKARWLGHDDRMTWAQAQTNLGLTDEQKELVLGKDKRAGSNGLNTLNTDTTAFRDTDVVTYQQLFYWRHFYHPEETNFKALQRLVFVDGLEEPVINEPYSAQKRVESRMAGVVRNPIQILTLTYISDDSLPPSDSTIIRDGVLELEDSRRQMAQQRRHSIPIRWYNPTLVSPGARSMLDKGTYQGFVPINGMGDRAIGEVSRASFPPEKFELDKIINNDIAENVQVGTNQAGAFSQGERSAREAGIIEKNFQRRVGQEQDKVTKHFVRIAEVLAGHIALYGTFELPDALGPMRQLVANAFSYSVMADSTKRLDADEQIDRLMKGINLTAQSGYVNLKPIIAKIWGLLGENPDQVVQDPPPKAPEPVKISISGEDWNNPFALASAMRTQQAGSTEDVQHAIEMIQRVMASMGGMGPMVGSPAGPVAPGQPLEPGDLAHPNWDTAARIEKRSADGGA